MEPQNVNWLYLLVGAAAAGVATFLAQFAVEWWKTKGSDAATRRNYSLLLQLEIRSALKVLDNLKASLQDNRYFAYRWIDILDKSVIQLDSLKNNSHLIESADLQEKFAALATDVSIFASDIRSIENIVNDGVKRTQKQIREREVLIEKERQIKLVELVDLKRRLEDILRNI